MEFKIFSGKIISIAYSKFNFKESSIIQRVTIEKNSKNFGLSFELKCPPGVEIFIRFFNVFSEQPWFYLFNSANIMKKVYRKDEIPMRGLNYHPITAALFVNLTQDFIFFIPRFPILGGMPNSSSFELNIHRFPVQDDHLGVGFLPTISYPVTHNWLIGFNKPDYDFIWKEFIEHKHYPLTYFKTHENLTEKIAEAQVHQVNWLKETSKQILKGDNCSYLNSLGSRDGLYVTTILNICKKSSRFMFDVKKKTFVGGFDIDIDRKVWGILDKIDFGDYNSEKLVLDTPSHVQNQMIDSFELVAFLSDLSEFRFQEFTKIETEDPGYDYSLLVLFVFFMISILILALFMLRRQKGLISLVV